MRLVKASDTPQAPTPVKTYYVQRFDDKAFTIKARYYYRTESTYVFTMSSSEDVYKAFMKGTPYTIEPLLEMDIEAVCMILDQDALAMEPAGPTKKRRVRKKSSTKVLDKSKTSK